MQGTGFTNKILNQDLKKLLLASGWAVKVVDGHSLPDLTKAMSTLHNSKPTCILANTIKGKGVSFMEQNLKYHYKDPQGEDFEIALKELTCES
jgi:transketolase